MLGGWSNPSGCTVSRYTTSDFWRPTTTAYLGRALRYIWTARRMPSLLQRASIPFVTNYVFKLCRALARRVASGPSPSSTTVSTTSFTVGSAEREFRGLQRPLGHCGIDPAPDYGTAVSGCVDLIKDMFRGHRCTNPASSFGTVVINGQELVTYSLDHGGFGVTVAFTWRPLSSGFFVRRARRFCALWTTTATGFSWATAQHQELRGELAFERAGGREMVE